MQQSRGREWFRWTGAPLTGSFVSNGATMIPNLEAILMFTERFSNHAARTVVRLSETSRRGAQFCAV